jgi:hypothetical protein
MDTLQDQLAVKDWATYMTGTLSEISGDLRFIVGFLALLNDFEMVTGPAETLSGTRLGVKSKTSKPFLEFRTLGIKLPKQKLFSTVQRRLGQGLPRRAHQVRGHFRTRRHGRRLPVEQWSWVPSHQRGDASLGFIHKDYNVEMNEEGE